MALLLNPQIFYYSTMVFQLAGVSNADVVTVAVGVVLVTASLATVSDQYFFLLYQKFFSSHLFSASLAPSGVPC